MSAVDAQPPAEPVLLGARWAALLCAALLAGLGLHAAARWLGTDSGQEKIVQQQFAPTDFIREAPDHSAPDPGDNP